MRKKDKFVFDYSMVIRGVIMIALLGLCCIWNFKVHQYIKVGYGAMFLYGTFGVEFLIALIMGYQSVWNFYAIMINLTMGYTLNKKGKTVETYLILT